MGLIQESIAKIFGVEFKTKDTDKDIDSPVRRDYDDGAAEVVTVGGGTFFQGYENIFDNIQKEHQLISEFRKLASCPEVDDAIEEIVNDAIVYPKNNKYPVKLDLENVEMSDPVKKKIVEEFEHILSLLKFGSKAHIYFRKWYVDGRLVFYIDTAGKVKKKGVDTFINLDPVDVKKIRKMNLSNTEGAEVIDSIEEMYIYIANSRMHNAFVGRPIGSYTIDGERQKGTKLTSDSVVYVTSGLTREDGQVLSYLYKALKVANQLNELEEALVIYRIARAPSRRVFYVDVGTLPTQKAESYLSSLMGKYKNKISYDPVKGTMATQSKQKAMLEDIWIPRREGGSGTEIDTIEGSDSFNGIIEEVQYFKHKLYTALNVPISRLEAESTFNFGKTGEITRDEVKFSKFITHLRQRFADGLFSQMLKTQGILKKLFDDKEWRDIIEPNLSYIFEEDSYFAEMKELDVLQNRLEVLDGMAEHTSVYFSKNYVRRNVLYQTDDEVAELKKEREKEAKEEPDDDEYGDDDGGGFGNRPAPKSEPAQDPEAEPDEQ